MFESPGFSKFRHLMDLADMFMEEEEEDNRMKHLLDSQGLVLFFKKGNDYFGSNEESRVVFARLKNPDDDTPDGWEEEANFTAINLTSLAHGHPTTHVFSSDDLPKIKIVDQDDVIKSMRNVSLDRKTPTDAIKVFSVRFDPQKDRDEAPNFIRSDEE